MDNLMTRQLDLILRERGVDYEPEFELEVNPSFLDTKGKTWLTEIYEDLGGQGELPLLQKLKFDFKIKRNLIIWDDELHFNRYRLISLRSDLYSDFNFQFTEGVKRVCRTFEKECLKAGLQERIWKGSPFAKSSFGKPSEPADFTQNGSPGWKLTAYNDAQMDLQSRIHGYKIFRLYPYETLMTGGSLKRLDQLLINPKEEQQVMIFNWLMRKLDS
jgi:hypothetical protein